MATIAAEPFDLDFDPATTALMIIDMQRDFVLPGGFGEALGNETSLLLTAVEPTGHVLAKAREIGMLVIHTREGHRPDLSDCPPAKLTRGGRTFIGTEGPMGRILVRGQPGHDIVPQLTPGVLEETDNEKLMVSFEKGNNNLAFGPGSGYTFNNYVLYGTEWKNGTTLVNYDSNKFRARCGSCSRSAKPILT